MPKKKKEVEFAEGCAVIMLPKDAFSVEVRCKVCFDGKVATAKKTLGPEEVRAAFQRFEDTVNGDFPVYALTDHGMDLLRQMQGCAE